MTQYITPDLCDEYPDLVQVVEPMFNNFGGRGGIGGRNTSAQGVARMNVKVQSRAPLQRNQNPRERRSTMQSVSKEFVKGIQDLIDDKHKEALRKVDYQYRSLKDMITSWHDGLEFNESLGVHNLPSLDGKDEEALDELMAELRAD